MEKKVYTVEIIGAALALLYAVSAWYLIGYLSIPEWKGRALLYLFLFGGLVIGSIAVVTLREWGRKLLILLNVMMILAWAVVYVPKIGLAPFSYFLMNLIVLLYFTQSQVKGKFRSKTYAAWHRSILIIDDDEGVIKILRPILLSHGYSVLTAETGETGIQVAATQKPDLILLDVILPGIKGREVCQQLKEAPGTRAIPVIFLTAKDSPDDIEAEKSVGAAAHLTKPVDATILMDTIHRVFKSQKES